MEHSDLLDPLSGHSPLSSISSSLFPPYLNPNNFGSLLSHLKNIVLRNPDSLVSQAEPIKDGGMELLESYRAKVSAFEGETEAPVAVNDKSHQETRPAPGREKNHRERRPGLGLREAKFTLKPTSSQAVKIEEPTIDIDKLSDPVEFVAALERMETAKKELRRIRGEPLDEVDLNHVSLLPRRVRPSHWRKSVTYKPHPYPSNGVPKNDDAFVSSQEANNHNIMSPTREAAIAESNAVKSPTQVRVSDVKTSRSSKVSELDELLSYDFKGLDEDGVQKLLQDKLNLKFVDIGEHSLPDMPAVRQREYSSVTQPLPNIKNSISHINDSSKAASSDLLNFSYHFRKGSDNQASPSLSKSPLAAISTLNKHISRLTPLKDPFLSIDVNLSSDKISHAVAQIGKSNDSQVLSRNPVNEEEATDASTSPSLAGKSKTADIESGDQLDGVSHSDQLVASKTSHNVGRSPSCTEDVGDSGIELPSVAAKDILLGDDSEERMNEIRQNDQVDSRNNLFEIRPPEDNEDNLAAFGEASLDRASKDVDASTVPIEIDDQTAAAPESVVNEVFSEGFAVEKALVNRGDTEMDEPLNTSGMLTEKLNKKTLQSSKSGGKEMEELTAPSQDNMTVNKGRKGRAKSNAAASKEPHNKKRKAEGVRASPRKVDEKLRRLSLYDAGTKWEAGVRRSTRIRMRPLEFWRGERFLYGRVHESTVSVIGVKYASPPAKSADEPVVKVKSFVSDKYKNLIDLASSY